MTSKISFFKLMQEDLRRKLWLLVLAILVFFISFPVVLLILLDSRKAYLSLTEEMWNRQMKASFAEIIGYENMWMCVITVVGATLCGIFAFSYLYKKNRVDFYHSIPVRREKLFLVSYLNGLLIYIVPYFVTILISMIIGGSYFTLDASLWSVAFREFGLQVLFYLLLYHAAILASVFAGNMFGCLFLNGIIQFYMVFLYGIFIAYCDYFRTYTMQYQNFGESIAKFSPISAFFNTMSRLLGGDAIYQLQLRDGEVSIKLYFVQCFLVAVLLLGLAMYFYKIRSSEMAGKAIAFRKIQPVIRILLVVPSAMVGGWIFTSLTNVAEVGWTLFGILFAAVLVHGVIEVLYQSDIRGIFSHKVQLVGSILAAVFLVFAFQRDIFGYDRYVPKLEKMESAAISIDGISDGEYYLLEDNRGGYRTIRAEAYQMEKMELSGELLPVVRELMSLGTEFHSYQTMGERISFDLKVRLKGGREMIRSYMMPLDQAYPLLEKIFQSQEYKEKSYAYFWEEYRNAQVEIEGLAKIEKLSKENGAEFLEIYQKELMELTLEDVRNNPIVGRIECLVLKEGEKYRSFDVQLYPVMTESMNYLEKIGILEKVVCWTQPKAEDIAALRIFGNGTEMGIVGEEEDVSVYRQVKVTDQEQIQKVCDRLYFHMGRKNWLFWDRGECEIQVVLKPEVSRKYFGEEEVVLEVMYRDFDLEEIGELMQKGERID